MDLERFHDLFHEPEYYACLELWVAARTDAALHRRLTTAQTRYMQRVRRVLREALGTPRDDGVELLAILALQMFSLRESLFGERREERQMIEQALRKLFQAQQP